MRPSASSSSSRGSLRKAYLLFAAGLTVAALPARPEAPRCDAQTCPPLQLRLEEGFQVSTQRLEQGMPAAVPAQDSTTPDQPAQPLPPQVAAEATSPWLVAAFALVAGMLLQGLVQGLLRRRRAVVAGAVVPTPAPMPISARATGLALEPPAAEPAATLDAGPLATFADLAGEPSEPVAVAEALPEPVASAEPPPADLPVIAETLPESLEAPQDPVLVELELPPNLAIAEAPAMLAESAEPEALAVACEALPETALPEAELFDLAESEAPEPSSEALAAIDAPPEAVEALPEPTEAPQDPVVFELESLSTSFTAEPPEAIAASEPTPEPEFPEAAPVASIESGIQELSGEAPVEFEFELDFPLEEPAAVAAAGEELPTTDEADSAVPADDWFMAAALTATGGDPATAAVPPEPVPVEAAAELPEPAPAAASDTHRLETVALLKRMSAQRARGLHPEARLASVFRRISSGRLEAADKSLRELEAFCSDSEEGFPSEMLTTRQHIALGRDHELGNRIDGLRARARDEASGRRLAVAGAFLRRGRVDAVAEVLDELESDLSREVEAL